MSSYTCSDSTITSDLSICTTASVFEKANSIKFELLFGKYYKKIECDDDKNDLINSFKYVFTPGQIFGFSYESFGKDFQKLHHAFVLQACISGEKGHIITGIQPGAKILLILSRFKP